MKTNKLTIATLRKNGHKVRCLHLRRVVVDPKTIKKLSEPKNVHLLKGKFKELGNLSCDLPQVVLPHGGQTIIEVDTKDGNNYKAVAETSVKDVFNKKAGVRIALTRIAHKANQNGESLI